MTEYRRPVTVRELLQCEGQYVYPDAPPLLGVGYNPHRQPILYLLGVTGWRQGTESAVFCRFCRLIMTLFTEESSLLVHYPVTTPLVQFGVR
jgi:hypothetical protein